MALRAAKQAISRSEDLPLETGKSFLYQDDSSFSLALGLDFERASYETLLTSQDRIEALQAFKEKRRPNFKGE